MSSVWDTVSLAPLVWGLTAFFMGDFWMLGGLVGTDLATKVFKRILPSRWTWTQRPPGATNCDIFSRNGPCGGRPGFPSGHMATTAFFVTSLYLTGKVQKEWVIVGGGAALVAVAMARFFKQCHTLLQIAAGTLVGCLCAVGLFCLQMKLRAKRAEIH